MSIGHLKLPISNKILVTIWQNCLYRHDSFITKFDFVNYAFAKLVVAWLYFGSLQQEPQEVCRTHPELQNERLHDQISNIKFKKPRRCALSLMINDAGIRNFI